MITTVRDKPSRQINAREKQHLSIPALTARLYNTRMENNVLRQQLGEMKKLVIKQRLAYHRLKLCSATLVSAVLVVSTYFVFV